MKTRLLIADSNAEIRDLRRRFFDNCGLDVHVADGGVSCLELLRQAAPHVLLMDLGLLWGGAEGVLARIREASDAPLAPVVLVGDRAALARNPHLSSAPVVAWHAHPVRMAALLVSVQAASNRQAGLSQLGLQPA